MEMLLINITIALLVAAVCCYGDDTEATGKFTLGPQFKVSSERQLIIVRLTIPGIEPTTANFQVERSNH